MNVTLRSAAIAVMFLSSAALADGVEQRAREEVEKQLKELVDIPAPRATIVFEAMDEPNFSLDGTEFLLDGHALSTPPPGDLSAPGPHRVYSGELEEGRHELIARIAYVDTSSIVMSEQGGFKWKVSAAVRFETRRGLDVTVRTVAERDPNERDVRKQIQVKFKQDVQMLAKVDTSVPPPLEKPRAVAQLPDHQAVDAGTPEAVPTPEPKANPGHDKGAQQVATRDVKPAGAQRSNPMTIAPAVARKPEHSTAANTESKRVDDSAVAQMNKADAGAPEAAVAAAEVPPRPTTTTTTTTTPVGVAPGERDAGNAVAAREGEQPSSESSPVVPISIGVGVLVVAVGALAFRRKR